MVSSGSQRETNILGSLTLNGTHKISTPRQELMAPVTLNEGKQRGLLNPNWGNAPSTFTQRWLALSRICDSLVLFEPHFALRERFRFRARHRAAGQLAGDHGLHARPLSKRRLPKTDSTSSWAAGFTMFESSGCGSKNGAKMEPW